MQHDLAVQQAGQHGSEGAGAQKPHGMLRESEAFAQRPAAGHATGTALPDLDGYPPCRDRQE